MPQLTDMKKDVGFKVTSVKCTRLLIDVVKMECYYNRAVWGSRVEARVDIGGEVTYVRKRTSTGNTRSRVSGGGLLAPWRRPGGARQTPLTIAEQVFRRRSVQREAARGSVRQREAAQSATAATAATG